MKAQTLVNAFNLTLLQRNRLLLVTCVSAFLNVLMGLSLFYQIGKERVIVVPPVIDYRCVSLYTLSG